MFSLQRQDKDKDNTTIKKIIKKDCGVYDYFILIKAAGMKVSKLNLTIYKN